jgi:hypothetical protein
MNRLRLAFAMAGFAAAIGAVATDDHWIGWLAIALLALALLLRLLQRNSSREHRQDESDTR